MCKTTDSGGQEPGTVSPAPDWARIAFDVPCGRCGENLRGHSESRCPRCGLAFDWDEVLPLERLRCPKCDYQLVGLDSQQCPECGGRFEWRDVLDVARRRSDFLFEYRWRKEPFRSLWRTVVLAAFRPRRLWDHYDLHQSPRVFSLLLFVVVQWVVFSVGYPCLGLVFDPAMDWLASRLGSSTDFVYEWGLFSYYLLAGIAWYVGTFLALHLFFESKRRYGVRWQHILRVYAHATVFASFVPLAWCVLEVIVDACLYFLRWDPMPTGSVYDVLEHTMMVLGALATWAHLWLGYRRYLKVPRGWAVAASALVIGYLLFRAIDKYRIFLE